MSSALSDLEAGLQGMLSLKPPGVSGSRIQSLTTLCNANIQSESVLVQKLYTHFKKAPGTHKLGVLYVVDSVTRKWTEQAKANGQSITSSAPEGTYAAGVHKVVEILPSLMNDIIASAPPDQKEKIKKLVEIWEKGQTFPLKMLNSFKEKLNEQTKSTTPDGTPPRNIPSSLVQQNTTNAAPPANTSSILEALANMARQNTNIPVAAAANVPQDNLYNRSSAQSNPALNAPLSYPSQAVNVPAPAPNFGHQGPSNGAQNYLSNPAAPQFGAVPPPQGAIDPAIQQQIMILKALSDQGIPQDQWAGIIAAVTATNAGNANGAAAPPPLPQYASNQAPNGWGGKPDESRDANGFRSPPSRFRRRSRSISPPRAWNARDSPQARRDQGYGDYDRGRDSPVRGRDDRGGRGGRNEYRQRSPQPRRARSPSPRGYDGPPREKWIEFDQSIGNGNVKVLSRTLFVGGVTSSDQDLREIFERFGQVQTCIVNKEKRHAFVKMISRKDALAAKEAMENNRADSQLRTRWGVGFGPRDCCNYQTGVSIIPINKLTDADRKWMLTADFGGTGGKTIEGGMVVEEPDIEIGAGVSSKAISRRMQTDRGGAAGPKSGRDRSDSDEPPSRFRKPERRDDDRDMPRHRRGQSRDYPTENAAAPAIPSFVPGAPPPPIPGYPGFPFQMGASGMPMFPPGFSFPGQTAGPPGMQQPPPPGKY